MEILNYFGNLKVVRKIYKEQFIINDNDNETKITRNNEGIVGNTFRI